MSAASLNRRRTLLLNLATSSFAIVLGCPIGQADQISKTIQASSTISREFSISLPNSVTNFAWSPDLKKIAISEFHTGKIKLVDVEKRQVTDTILGHGNNTATMAWSPDSKLLAIGYSHHLRLVSFDGIEVTSVRNPLFDCRIPVLVQLRAMAFTVQGNSIWAACQEWDVRASYISAIKLSVPGLELLEKRMQALPEPGNRSSVRGYRVTRVGSAVLLSSIIWAFDYAGSMPSETRNYLTVQNLEASGHSSSTRITHTDPNPKNIAMQSATNGVMAAAIWFESPQLPTISVVGTSGESVIRLFGNAPELSGARVQDLHFFPSGTGLITIEQNDPNYPGHIAIWNSETGQLIDHLKTAKASYAELSADGRELAVLEANEITFYKLNPKVP